MKAIIAASLAFVLAIVMGSAAYADPSYDFSLSAYATANTTTVPSVITWHLTVDSIGDDMGNGGAQEGTIEFTAPASISLVISDDCDTTGNAVTCSWLVEDGTTDYFEVSGLVSLLAVGDIIVTPTLTYSTPRIDSLGTNDTVTVTCTAITSAIITC